MKVVSSIFILYFFCNSFILQAQNEGDFYTETIDNGIVKNFVDDYGANGNDNIDDSQLLQSAIDDITKIENGGKLIIPEGVYYLADIIMKSNVHLEINKNVLILPPQRTNTKNYKIFALGGKNKPIRNVSIRGNRGRFTVDLRKVNNINVGVFSCTNVENFLISGFTVLDSLTKFSAINCGVEIDGTYNSPKNGVIKNAHIDNAHYGYGLIQTQAGQNILFKNLSGTGGVTLRWETGYNKMNELQVGGVFNMVARNISCEFGNAAIMISPHAIQNGHVEADTVYANNCGFAVRIGNGYVKADQEPLGLKPGYFANTSWIKNVTAVYGDSAQLKSKHFKYMPCVLRDSVNQFPSDTHNTIPIYQGPSIAAVLNQGLGEGTGKYLVTVSNIEAIGFMHQQKGMVTVEDEDDCSGNVTRANQKNESVKVEVYPNPFNNKITVEIPSSHFFRKLQLIDSVGKIVHQEKIENQKYSHIEINSNKMPSGFYFLKLIGDTELVEKKLIKNQ